MLDRAPPQQSDDRLVRLVAGIKAAAPDRTLQQIAAQLEAMRERTPRGGTRWHPSSVKHLLASVPAWTEPSRRMPRLGDERNCGRPFVRSSIGTQIKAHIVIAFLACCLHALWRRLHASAPAV